MIISKLIKVVLISTFVFSVGVLAVPSTSECGCQTSCSDIQAKVKEPSWWNWLTRQNSSQFHFFDLMELLHKDDSDLSVNQDKEDTKRQASS